MKGFPSAAFVKHRIRLSKNKCGRIYCVQMCMLSELTYNIQYKKTKTHVPNMQFLSIYVVLKINQWKYPWHCTSMCRVTWYKNISVIFHIYFDKQRLIIIQCIMTYIFIMMMHWSLCYSLPLIKARISPARAFVQLILHFDWQLYRYCTYRSG